MGSWQLWAEAVDAKKAIAAAGRLRSVGVKRMVADVRDRKLVLFGREAWLCGVRP